MCHNYKVIKHDGTEVINNRNAACYADYAYGYSRKMSKFGEHKVHIMFDKKGQPLVPSDKGYGAIAYAPNAVQFVEITQGFANSGFPIHEVTEDDGYFTMILNEADYLNRSHVRLLLDLNRGFFEGSNGGIGARFFTLPEEIRNHYNFMKLLQLVAIRYSRERMACTGHAFPTGNGNRKFLIHSVKDYTTYLSGFNKDYNGFVSNTWSELTKQKFAAYKAAVPNAKPEIVKEKWEELMALKFTSNAEIYRALRIINPIPREQLDLMKKEKEAANNTEVEGVDSEAVSAAEIEFATT